jgi:hypothetical protein
LRLVSIGLQDFEARAPVINPAAFDHWRSIKAAHIPLHPLLKEPGHRDSAAMNAALTTKAEVDSSGLI